MLLINTARNNSRCQHTEWETHCVSHSDMYLSRSWHRLNAKLQRNRCKANSAYFSRNFQIIDFLDFAPVSFLTVKSFIDLFGSAMRANALTALWKFRQYFGCKNGWNWHFAPLKTMKYIFPHKCVEQLYLIWQLLIDLKPRETTHFWWKVKSFTSGYGKIFLTTTLSAFVSTWPFNLPDKIPEDIHEVNKYNFSRIGLKT